MFKVTVDPEKCVGDEECIEVCPVDVYELQDGKSVPVRAEECLGCERAAWRCVAGRDYDHGILTKNKKRPVEG